MMLGMSTGVDGLAYRFYSDALDRLNIAAKDLQKVMAQTGESRSRIEGLLNLL
jgi:hypothetical protein